MTTVDGDIAPIKNLGRRDSWTSHFLCTRGAPELIDWRGNKGLLPLTHY